METIGNDLSVTSSAVYKSTHVDNGILQKIDRNEYSKGYLKLLNDAGADGEQYFGWGVFYDASGTAGYVYNSATSRTTPVLAGIIARDGAISGGGYPALYNKVSSFNKGKIAVQGFLNYKALDTIASTSSSRTTITLSQANIQDVFAIRLSDGAPCLGTVSEVAAAVTAGTHVIAGKVVTYNPDGDEVTIDLTPGISIIETGKSTANDIIAFAFLDADNKDLSADYTATIVDNAISVTVPSGTDVTELVASFATNGVAVYIGTIPQVSGTTENDFTSAVTYTVIAEDGTTQDYTVTVTVSA